MKDKLIIANHKMNLNADDLNKYLDKISKINNKNVIICPTSIYIPYFINKTQVGIQNVYCYSKGSYTGEISPMQAKSLGVNYVIVGHSERRCYFEESDILINKKIVESLNNNLKVILCIGETLEQKNMLKTDQVLKRQIINSLNNINSIDNIIIAYEPVWAIGTGIVPDTSSISSTISYIRTIIDKLFPNNSVKILYGGSVTEKNIVELNKIKEVNGFLVGGASLNPDEFLKIVEVVAGQ